MYDAGIRIGVNKPYAPPFLKSTLLVLWSFVVITTPLYALPSGLPQLADFIMVGLLVVLIATFGVHLKRSEKLSAGFLLAFAGYAFIVNTGWALILSTPTVLVHSAYYAFNALVYIAILTLHNLLGKRFLHVTMWSALASVFVQVAVTLIFFDSSSFRQSGTFNNPNQLSYFALLSGSLLFMAMHYLPIKRIYLVTAFSGVLLLTVFSLSKAAIVGAVFLILNLALKRPIVIVFISVMFAALLYTTDLSDVLFENLIDRLDSFGQSDDSFAGRGYDRIVNHMEYLILGAGEGAYERFNSLNAGNELHSSIGTLLFSYGFFGSLLFAGFLYSIFARARGVIVVSFIPLLLYSITHQGLRFTTLWILLAVAMCFINASHTSSTERA